VIILEGRGLMDGKLYQMGEVWRTGGAEFAIQPGAPTAILRTYAPAGSQK
jgi:hypothetical protein